MDLPVLDKFCFIYPLKTGCIIMGILNTVYTMVLAAVLIVFVTDKESADIHTKEDAFFSVVYSIAMFLIILLLIKFLLDVVFVIAVIKGLRTLMSRFCIFWIIFLILFTIGFLKTMFHMGAGHIIAQIIFLAENVYYIIVIKSYLMSINEE